MPQVYWFSHEFEKFAHSYSNLGAKKEKEKKKKEKDAHTYKGLSIIIFSTSELMSLLFRLWTAE